MIWSDFQDILLIEEIKIEYLQYATFFLWKGGNKKYIHINTFIYTRRNTGKINWKLIRLVTLGGCLGMRWIELQEWEGIEIV